MPRLTNTAYLDRRHRLMDAWEFRSHLIAELESFEQMDLHKFFAISKNFYDDEALVFRRDVAKLEPSLPSQAGRAYAKFERIVAADKVRRDNPPVEVVRAKDMPRPKKVVRVTGLVRPELNMHAFARALVNLAVEDEKNGWELYKRLKK